MDNLKILEMLKNKSQDYRPYRKRFLGENSDNSIIEITDEEMVDILTSSNLDMSIPQMDIFLRYRKATGEYSERRVIINGLTFKNNNAYLQAIDINCTPAIVKSFRLDRVVEILNFETGEVVGHALDAIKMLVEKDSDIQKESKNERNIVDLAIKHIFRKLKNELIILTYFANVDGEYHKKELEVVYNYVKTVVKAYDIESMKESILDVLYCFNPSRASFDNAVKNLEENLKESEHPLLFDILYDLIMADGKYSDEEKQLKNDNEVLDI